MAIEVLPRREGSRLVAADSLSAESIASIKKDETVTALIRRPRHPRHHAKLFVLLNAVFEQQITFATLLQLLGAIKRSTGLFDTGITIDKIPYVVPNSISFASMCQSEFEQWYEKTVNVVLTKILPAATEPISRFVFTRSSTAAARPSTVQTHPPTDK
jgi:hypothetical protein